MKDIVISTNNSSALRNIGHYLSIMDSFRHIYYTKLYDEKTRDSWYIQGAFILYGIAVEHLLKSPLKKVPYRHNLNELLRMVKDLGITISPDDEELVGWTNNLVHPTGKSLRYNWNQIPIDWSVNYDLSLYDMERDIIIYIFKNKKEFNIL